MIASPAKKTTNLASCVVMIDVKDTVALFVLWGLTDGTLVLLFDKKSFIVSERNAVFSEQMILARAIWILVVSASPIGQNRFAIIRKMPLILRRAAAFAARLCSAPRPLIFPKLIERFCLTASPTKFQGIASSQAMMNSAASVGMIAFPAARSFPTLAGIPVASGKASRAF